MWWQIVSLLALLVLLPRGAVAQPVGSGPLSDVSRSVKDGSRSVHERGRSVSDGTVGSMKSGPVRGDRRVGMSSGSVSDASAGPVTSGRPMTGGGSMTENSAGAVKNEMDRSLGEQVYDLQRTLGPLQERLRQQAESDAVAAQEEAAEEAAVQDDTIEQEQGFDMEPPDNEAQLEVDERETAEGGAEALEAEAPVDSVDEAQPSQDELDN